MSGRCENLYIDRAFYFMNKVVYIDLNIECFCLKTVSYLFLREAVY